MKNYKKIKNQRSQNYLNVIIYSEYILQKFNLFNRKNSCVIEVVMHLILEINNNRSPYDHSLYL